MACRSPPKYSCNILTDILRNTIGTSVQVKLSLFSTSI